MTERIRVYAIPGKVLPHPGRLGSFVGYAEVQDEASADHVVPGGKFYKLLPEGEVVQNVSFVRRALVRGDLSRDPASPIQQSDPVPEAAPADTSEPDTRRKGRRNAEPLSSAEGEG